MVEHRGEWFCSVAAPKERLLALVTRGSGPATVLSLPLSADVSLAEAPGMTDDEKLRRMGLTVGPRLLVRYLVDEVELLFFDAEQAATEDLRRAVEMLDEFKAVLLIPRDPGRDAKERRDRLISAHGGD